MKAQPNQNTCATFKIPPGIFYKTQCNDVVVQKTSADGRTVYTRVLTGESDQESKQFVFDAANNVVLLGTTYSKQFPVTPDAVQSANAGPALASDSISVQPGGDLFLAVISPAGDLAYSTFLGSSGNDTVLGVHAATGTQVDVLAAAGAGNFPALPVSNATPGAGPVLFTFDSGSRTLVRSGYLPIAAPGSTVPYVANMQSDGTVAVTTAAGLYTFGRDGQQRSLVSLASFAFAFVPQMVTDPSGDLWLWGPNTSGQWLMTKLTAGTVEAFRWTLPTSNSTVSYLMTPFFAPDGSAYVLGAGTLTSTTSNALLTAPCAQNSARILAVLGSQGDLKLLTYLPGPIGSFQVNADGSVSAVLFPTNQVIAIDLSQTPKAGCVADVLDRSTIPPPTLAVGEVVRLRGGGFGPDSTTATAPDAHGIYPLVLGSLSVQVAGVNAPILSAGPSEVVFAIPFETADGDSVPVTVLDRGQQSVPLPIAVRESAPWLIGPAWNQDWTANSLDTPANWGSVVTLFVTGAGPFSPPLADGQIAPLDASHGLQQAVSAGFLITGPEPDPAKILYAGPAPGMIGVTQINMQLPAVGPYSFFTGMLTIGSVSTYLPSFWAK